MTRLEMVATYGPRVLDDLDRLVAYLDEVAMVVERGREAYLRDVLAQRAVEGILNRIGDTIRNRVPADLQDALGGQDYWSGWVGLRVVVAHHDQRIDLARVWRTLAHDAPAFRLLLGNELREV